MKANNIAVLLNAAAYVRNETIINGNQAAQLDSLTNAISELKAIVERNAAKIAERIANGLNAEMLERMTARYKTKLADAVANLRAWLVDFKNSRPNVQINIEETEEQTTTTPETPNPDNTPSTMNANETTEFSELTHAGQCLDIYLHNTSDIYERYTVPAINAVVEAVRRNGWQLPKEEAIKNLTFWTSWQDGTKKALQAAARLVKKHDHITPTAKDIEQVTRNYAAYIVDCAKYEIEK